MRYVTPALAEPFDGPGYEENGYAVFIAAIGWVLLVFGSAWAFCYASCYRNGGIKSCTASWLNVKAVCKG